MEIKCPICGSKKIIKISDMPFDCSGDATLHSNSEIKFCTECGYVMLFMTDYLKKYNNVIQRIKYLTDINEQLNNKINELKNENFDFKKYESLIQQQKDEIEQLKKLGVDGKAVHTREDAIKGYEKILESGVEPNIEGQIHNATYEINQNNKEIEKLNNSLTNL